MQKQGIRQIRLNDPDKIRTKMSQSVGSNVNLVFHNGRPLTGRIVAVNGDHVEIENMRLKKLTFTFAEISELYIDLVV